jgi:hypothetical protein
VDSFLTTLTPSDSTKQTDIVNNTPAHPSDNPDEIVEQLNESSASAKSDKIDKDDDNAMDTSTSSSSKSPPPPSLDDGASVSSLLSKVSSRKRGPPSSPSDGPQQKRANLVKQSVPLLDLIANKTTKKVPEQNIVKTNMTRSIYISPFEPSATPADVISHLESNDDLKFIVPNVVCKILKGRQQRVSFVSFRLDVPRHHYDILVNPVIWQKNGKDVLTVSEFIEKRAARDPIAAASNEFNPFSERPNMHNMVKNRRPLKMADRDNRNHQQFTPPQMNSGMHHQQRPRNRRPSKPVGQNRQQTAPAPYQATSYQHERPNFQYGCQKQCCKQPRQQCINCHDHCVENRYGHRPRNRR